MAAPRIVHAAGALVWRMRDSLEVALVHRPRYDDWSWPKGKLDRGETSVAGAVREVHEETGIPIRLGVPLPTVRYPVNGATKQVRYWAATEAEHDWAPLTARPPVHLTADEVDEVRWVSATKARKMLAQKVDQRPLDALVALHELGRLETSILAVARHGQAVRRKSWSGEESTRPLTRIGKRQSTTLTGSYAAFGIEAVVTSPWERCRASVEPYLESSGLDARLAKQLTEDAHSRKPSAVLALVEELLSTPTNTLISTHRPVLSTVMEAASEATRRWTVGTLPTRDPYLRTAEVLVLHVNHTKKAPRVVCVEHLRPARSTRT